MEKVKCYAEANGILLKGDIPILLSPDSADVWANRSLFNLQLVAGAPPDYYNHLGQKWGFPLFNWDEMRKSHFDWWKQRLKLRAACFTFIASTMSSGFSASGRFANRTNLPRGIICLQIPINGDCKGREILEMMINASPLLPMAEDFGKHSRHRLSDTA